MSIASGPLGSVIDNSLGVHEATFRWGEASAADLIAAGVEFIGENPNVVFYDTDEDGNPIEDSVWDIIPDYMELPNAVRRFRNNANNVGDGSNKRDVIAYSAWKYLSAQGEFFQTEGNNVYYFYDPESRVYRVSGDGSQEVTQEFRALVHELTGLSTGKDGRAALVQIHDRADRNAPERDAHKFGAWDEDEEVLYMTDFDDGYYRIDGDTIEHRDNGEDVFFLDYNGDPYEYLDPADRADFNDAVPGELSKWHQQGDLLMRFFGNRTNFDPSAILQPEQQRTQMYVHLHAMSFINFFTAKPITAFVGEKGSGKTVIQRSVGKFLFGGDWKESMMPSEREDFAAIVNNRPLAFVDNFDQAVDWANDILASTATGSADIRRELFTTMDMKQTTPDCFIALTSRDPPFRRDDVADRTVVFRVTRLDNFVGMRGFLNPVSNNRDSLWSVYLDNLNEIVSEMQDTDMLSMVSTHRMSDWAAFAKVVGNALNIGGVDETLDVMQQERALFALEDDSLFRTLRKWLSDRSTDSRGIKWQAGDLLDELDQYAMDNNIDFTYNRAQTLGKRLNNVSEEMDELFGFTIHDDGRTTKYEFVSSDQLAGVQGALNADYEDDDDNPTDTETADDEPEPDSTDDATDAATPEEPDGPDDADSSDDAADGDDDDTQLKRITAIMETVESAQEGFGGGVPEDAIVTMVSDKGFLEQNIKDSIEKLCRKGRLYEPADNEYRTT